MTTQNQTAKPDAKRTSTTDKAAKAAKPLKLRSGLRAGYLWM